MQMKKIYGVSAALVLVIVLAACGTLMPSATLASSEAKIVSGDCVIAFRLQR